MVFMKKNQLFYLITFLFISILFSCDKSESEGSDDLYQSWVVMDFLSVESNDYPKDKNFSPVIEFRKDGHYSLKLDVNNCSGSFTLMGESSINIFTAGCTKICCDSKFSQKFVAMIPQLTSYSIEGKEMKLIIPGWGWIELKAVK
jgi:heat shock protein HslJ